MKFNKLFVFALPLIMGLTSCGGGASTSSKTSAKSSKPAASSTSRAPAKTFSMSTVDLTKDANGKVGAIVKGSVSNYTADEMKFAFGLKHVEVTGVDTKTDWVVGSATPADADYKVAPVVAANGSFEVTFDLSAITTLEAGAYEIYAGIKGQYTNLMELFAGTNGGEGAMFGGTKVTGAGFKMYIRSDVNALILDKAAPMALTEAFFEEGETDHKPYLFIGGEMNVDAATFNTYKPFLQFQTNGNNNAIGRVTGDGAGQSWYFYRQDVEGTPGSNKWTSTKDADGKEVETGRVSVEVRGNKGYVKCDLSEMLLGGFNTHLNVESKTQADCKMDADIDTTNSPKVIGSRKYSVYSDTSAGADDASKYWGNLAVIINNA